VLSPSVQIPSDIEDRSTSTTPSGQTRYVGVDSAAAWVWNGKATMDM